MHLRKPDVYKLIIKILNQIYLKVLIKTHKRLSILATWSNYSMTLICENCIGSQSSVIQSTLVWRKIGCSHFLSLIDFVSTFNVRSSLGVFMRFQVTHPTTKKNHETLVFKTCDLCWSGMFGKSSFLLRLTLTNLFPSHTHKETQLTN